MKKRHGCLFPYIRYISNDNLRLYDMEENLRWGRNPAFNPETDFLRRLEYLHAGCEAATLHALNLFEKLSDDAEIVDIGCGTGAHTFLLAQHLPGHINAVDIFPEMIVELLGKVRDKQLQTKITGVIAPFDNLPFGKSSVDLIWAENTISLVGFQKALKQWKELVKPGGTIAFTIKTWLTGERPPEIQDYANRYFSDTGTIPAYSEILQKCGYEPVAHFIARSHSFREGYREHFSALVPLLLQKYIRRQAIDTFLRRQERSMELLHRYQDYYNDVFFICKKSP